MTDDGGAGIDQRAVGDRGVGSGPGFDWRVYSDATCAGLSALIPIPLLDLVFEGFFRRRMPAAIARARDCELPRLAALGLARRRRPGGMTGGCLALPAAAGRYLVKRMWRKVIYVFAVADASALVSDYWHRAYLLDHVVRAGHAAPGSDVARMLDTFHRVLSETDSSPLRGLARQVVRRSRHVLGLLLRARRRGSAAATGTLAATFDSQWRAVEASLLDLAIRYNRAYIDARGAPRRDSTASAAARQTPGDWNG